PSGLAAEYATSGGLCKCLDHELVHVDVRRPGDREEDAFGDVLGFHRLDALVDPAGGLLIAAETDTREIGLDQPWIDRRDVDRAAEQVLAQGVREAANGELRGHVER